MRVSGWVGRISYEGIGKCEIVEDLQVFKVEAPRKLSICTFMILGHHGVVIGHLSN